MAKEMIDFTGQVPSQGYRLIAVRAQKGVEQVVVPARPAASSPPLRTYRLSELNVVLFRVFAETRPDAKGVLDFANRYGPLGREVEVEPVARNTVDPADGSRGEPLWGWRKQISAMLGLATVWTLCEAGDSAALAPHFRWEEKGGRVRLLFDSHPEGGEGGPAGLGHFKRREDILPPDPDPDRIERLRSGGVLAQALDFLQRGLDRQLRRDRDRFAARMVWDAGAGRPALRLVPPTLGAALWVQFADAVANERTHVRCQRCARWFEVAAEATRAHRKFCSDSCRIMAYRDRQDAARRLHAGGKSFEDVAREVGSTAATVERWVTGVKEERQLGEA